MHLKGEYKDRNLLKHIKPQGIIGLFLGYSLVAKHMAPEHMEWSTFPSTDENLLNIKTSIGMWSERIILFKNY